MAYIEFYWFILGGLGSITFGLIVGLIVGHSWGWNRHTKFTESMEASKRLQMMWGQLINNFRGGSHE
jgi:hypothetical protein